MAVVNVKENWSGFRYRVMIKQRKRTLKRVFTALMDGTDDPDMAVHMAAEAVEALAAPDGVWSKDQSMRLTEVGDVTPRGPLLLEVPIEYESTYGSAVGTGPFEADYDIEEGEYVSREAVDTTPFPRIIIDGSGNELVPNEIFASNLVNNSITNILGETYDPASMTDWYDWQLNVSFNVPFINRQLLSFMLGKLNGADFAGFGPGLVKLHGVKSRKIIDGTLTYRRLSMQFLARTQEMNGVNYGWLDRRLHTGTRGWINTAPDGTPNVLALTDNDGNPFNKGVMLDQSGVPLSFQGDSGSATWMLIQHFNNGLADFGVLGLDEDQL